MDEDRNIRIDLYLGFADAPRAYDKLKVQLSTGYDIDRVKQDIANHVERMVEDLEDIRYDSTDY